MIALSILLLILVKFGVSDKNEFVSATDQIKINDSQTLNQIPSSFDFPPYFVLNLNNNSSSFSLASKAQPNISIWQTHSLPFLFGNSVSSQIIQTSGDYVIKDKILLSSTGQTLDSCQNLNNNHDKDKQDNDNVYEYGSTLTCEGFLTFEAQTVPYKLYFNLTSENHFSVTVSIDQNSNKIFNGASLLYFGQDKNEAIMGFGFQYSIINMRGRLVPVFVREQGVGRGLEPLTFIMNNFNNHSGGDWHTSYGSIPHYLTQNSNMYYSENSEYSLFDFRSSDGWINFFVNSSSLSFIIIHSNQPLDAITQYTNQIGRMRALPDWISEGAVVGMQGGTDFVKSKYEALTNQGCPISAFWLQDWVGSRIVPWGVGLWWNWEVDEVLYHDWETLISDLKQKNIRMMVYVNPLLKDVSTKPNYRTNYYQEALNQSYFVVDGDTNQPWTGYAGASMVDLTNAEAVAWYKKIIYENILSKGISGYMADFGESLPLTASLHSGFNPVSTHNRWPELWMKLNREIVDQYGLESEIVYFSRSASMHSVPYTSLSWLGDQLTSFDEYDGLKTAVIGMLTSGLSGFAYSHSDIGGYTAVPISQQLNITISRSKTLFFRWCELSALTSVYRTHDGNFPSLNWKFYDDNETLAHFTRMAKVYSAWDFYRKTLIEEGATKGWPVVRSTFLHFYDDPNTLGLKYQYLIGDQFLVAPFLDDGPLTTVQVYIPILNNGNDWINVWTDQSIDKSFQGKTVDFPVQVGKPLILIQSNSSIGALFIKNLDALGLRL